MPYCSAKHRFRPSRLGLITALLLAVLPAPGRCQTDAPVHYCRFREFEIPFDMDPGRAVQEFRLHAATEGSLYKQVATAPPGTTRFTYKADADGWYNFVVQVAEQGGRLTPSAVGPTTPPGLRICVDTVKPLATLKAVAPDPMYGNVAVEWEVKDENLDLATLKLQFAVRGSDRWVALNIRQMKRAKFTWSPAGTGPFDVRLQVSDLAGNTTTALAAVAPGAVLPGGAAAAGGPRVIHVRTKTFKLNYKTDNIGPSSVKHVEVWMTRDHQKVWNKYQGGEAPANGPFEITVPTTGLYGFILRPLSGVGRGAREPSPGQQPQIWIQVDEQAPVVALLGPVIVGEGDDEGYITIHWSARDDHFRARPITILYAERIDGEWKPIQANIDNTGTYKGPVKGLPFQFYVKVEAIDEAGNKGSAQTREPVKVDLKIPASTILGVEGPGAEASLPKP